MKNYSDDLLNFNFYTKCCRFSIFVWFIGNCLLTYLTIYLCYVVVIWKFSFKTVYCYTYLEFL